MKAAEPRSARSRRTDRWADMQGKRWETTHTHLWLKCVKDPQGRQEHHTMAQQACEKEGRKASELEEHRLVVHSWGRMAEGEEEEEPAPRYDGGAGVPL